MPLQNWRATVSITALLLLNACGGGSSGGTSTTPTPPTPPTVTPDTTAPTVTLNGDAYVQVEQGGEYTDLGASAVDDVDGDLTVSIDGEVDASQAATYIITYSATDSAGNTASVEREVVVADTQPPQITLTGGTNLELNEGTDFEDPGASAVDSVDGSLTVSVTGVVGTEAGIYTLTYSATDLAGNSSTVQRVVTVVEVFSNDDDLLVFNSAEVGPVWDRGINAFDEAIGFGDCSNDGGAACPSISWSFIDDAEKGTVLQVVHGSSGLLAGLFFGSSSGVDLTSFANGNLEFSIKVVSGDPKITMKLDCFYPCTSGEQQLGERGASGWQRVIIPVSQLIRGGLEIDSVNTGLVIWASEHTDTTFLLDDVRFTGFDPTGERPEPPSVNFKLTALGQGSYSDTINPDSYRCVYDYGNWIYNAGVVQPGIGFCDTETGRPEGDPTPIFPQTAGAAATKPTMTHRWWGSVSFIGEMRIDDPNGAGYLTPDPLTVRLSERGVRVLSIPAGLRADAGGFIYPIPTPFSEVFDGAAVGNSAHNNMDVKLLDYSEGSVTAGWYDGNVLVMEATFVHSSPYIFFTTHSGSPLIKTLRSTGSERGVWHNGDNSLGIWTSVAGQHNNFLIVGESGTTFDGVDTDTVTVNTNDGKFTLAWVPTTNTTVSDSLRELVERHARSEIAHVAIDYSVDRSTNKVTVQHRYLGGNGNTVETLIGLQPLAWKRAQLTQFETSVRSARGVIKFAVTDEFDYEMDAVGVLPSLPVIDNAFDTSVLRGLVDDFVERGPSYWNTANDTYWNGKAVGRVAEVLAIADQMGMDDAEQTLRSWLKAELSDWMRAERGGTLDTENYFVYDANWNTLLGMEESFASHQQLNDHHFHYGYFIRAAAEVCRVDKDFCSPEQYGDMFEMLIRDYAGGRDDPMFPYLRNFDPAYGFSWASGNVNFVRGNNNESTSEAANAYGAMVLYGLVTDNQALIERGMYLHASTAATYWEYWNDIDGYRGVSDDRRNFPPNYPRLTTSIIWGDGSAFATWFSGAFAHILGIQGLPSNPLIMHVGLYADYLEEYVKLGLSESSNGKPSGLPDDQWTDLWWNLWAMTDPDAAIADYESTPTYAPEAGEARAHTFHWLYTMRAIGQLATGTGALTADHPSAMAFKTSEGLTTYIAYNFSDEPLLVTFSNGATLNVPANAFGISSQ